jgi:hypothetical protein
LSGFASGFADLSGAGAGAAAGGGDAAGGEDGAGVDCAIAPDNINAEIAAPNMSFFIISRLHRVLAFWEPAPPHRLEPEPENRLAG